MFSRIFKRGYYSWKPKMKNLTDPHAEIAYRLGFDSKEAFNSKGVIVNTGQLAEITKGGRVEARYPPGTYDLDIKRQKYIIFLFRSDPFTIDWGFGKFNNEYLETQNGDKITCSGRINVSINEVDLLFARLTSFLLGRNSCLVIDAKSLIIEPFEDAMRGIVRQIPDYKTFNELSNDELKEKLDGNLPILRSIGLTLEDVRKLTSEIIK
jgi:hypothetical protein